MSRYEFPEYTIDYISGTMSLRKPQKDSLKILDNILSDIDLKKCMDLNYIKNSIHDIYPIFKGFDRNFMSLTFALATGVGKTRLMGTFITYLYTNHGIKNFFIVAPSLTIYNKLINDFSNSSSDKYVFNGVGCFTMPPNIITGDDYRNKQLNAFSEVNIYIFNSQKFNDKKEEGKVNSLNEFLGSSFMEYLSNLEDLVVIMDEAHHYRNNATSLALDRINPLFGIELTATPQVIDGKKVTKFNNVVFDYPLAKSIRDGYTRTPYALTRKDLKKYNWTEEELDKMMLDDGIKWHERIKSKLIEYSNNNNQRKVKPFMLVVCKDIDHARKINEYIKSEYFSDGKYIGKVLQVDSGKSKQEKDENVELLLNVEQYDNPIEIVIHVDMLKEGWDVNNLYTIVPLRTANSQTLIEQTIGRGLRLPYGKRTGDRDVDSVSITAHDNFEKIIENASREDSIFRKENIIELDTLEEVHPEKIKLNIDFGDSTHEEFYKSNPDIKPTDKNKNLLDEITKNVEIIFNRAIESKNINANNFSEKLEQEIDNNKDLSQIIEDSDLNKELLRKFVSYETNRKVEAYKNLAIAIPIIDTEASGEEKYYFEEFELDVSNMNYVPVSQEIIQSNILDKYDSYVEETFKINFLNERPEKTIVTLLRQKGEINYEECSDLLIKLISTFIANLKLKYSDEDIKNIVFANKKDITDKIYNQMLQHLKCSNVGLIECVRDISTQIICPTYSFANDNSNVKNLYDSLTEEDSIRRIIFSGGKKSLLEYNKFDSKPELDFAISCDNDSTVLKWLRPAPEQFKLRYNHGKRYEPDFVVETAEFCYLVEIKGTHNLDDRDVLAKKERAVQYCKVASEWCKANGYKEWKHLFIPHDKVSKISSFKEISKAFLVN